MIHTDYGYDARSRDRLLLVRLYGEIDHHSAVALREDLDSLLMRERPLRLVFDLSRVDFMDSAGLGLLMGRYRLMKTLGGVVAVERPCERVLRILRLAGMERFFEIVGAKGERICWRFMRTILHRLFAVISKGIRLNAQSICITI